MDRKKRRALIALIVSLAFTQMTVVSSYAAPPVPNVSAANGDKASTSTSTDPLLDASLTPQQIPATVEQLTDETLKDGPLEFTVQVDSGTPVEIFAATLKTLAAHQTISEAIQQKLDEIRNRDPKAKIVATVQQPDGNIQLTSADKAKIEVDRLHLRVIVIARTILSGGSVFYSIHFLPHAILVGVVAGLMSGAYAFNSKPMAEFLSHSSIAEYLKKSNPKTPTVVVHTAELGESLTRFLALEIPFVLILQYAEAIATGQHGSLLPAALALVTSIPHYVAHDGIRKLLDALTTSSSSVLSQGVAESGISKDMKIRIDHAQTPTQVRSARLRLLLIGMAISAVSTAAAATDHGSALVTVGHFKITIGKILFGLIGTGGMLNYAYVKKQTKHDANLMNSNGEPNSDDDTSSCEDLLKL